MQIARLMRAWLLLLALGAVAAGCSGEPETQVVTGRVALREDAVAIRAVSGTTIVTAAQVRTDGSFTLVLPSGSTYRLEILTRTGAIKHLVTGDAAALRDIAFRVCRPIDPYSLGSIDKCGDPPPPCNDPSDPNCKCNADGTCCDPATGANCDPPPPPPCDPTTDPNCSCNPDGTCPPPPPPCNDPTDPNCKCNADGTCCDPTTGENCDPTPPPPCDPTTDPNCNPTPCTDPTDPDCKCNPDGTCCDPTTGENCGSTCDDPNTPGCLPPCADPTDPNTCKDPCVEDPSVCGCKADDPNCWPPPEPCDPDGTCKPGEGVTAQYPPSDFGCTAEAPGQ